ncbi:DinB family protein [Paenibacillus guangzhouensis]|uniref:DinB family protein n=1 Tax=Paenibacillus guangzhouensis TaxID=1473112 RepID=UPI0012677060|nr:DinB family protein [Paenibacillus guangzhouensis]
MNFNLDEAIEVLERTPKMLEAFLSGLSDAWLQCNEGEGTWNVTEVLNHLIEGERVNWMPRLEHMLQAGASKPFPPFDRYANLQADSGNTLEQQLQAFRAIRAESIAKLRAIPDLTSKLELTGTHPVFGEVRVRELLSTWTVHDMTHIAQIVRVMGTRYRADVGPWIAYLGILNQK